MPHQVTYQSVWFLQQQNWIRLDMLLTLCVKPGDCCLGALKSKRSYNFHLWIKYVSYMLSRGGEKLIFMVVIHLWRSPLHQFVHARTIDEYDVTMPVPYVNKYICLSKQSIGLISSVTVFGVAIYCYATPTPNAIWLHRLICMSTCPTIWRELQQIFTLITLK